jgi:NSS family neurotransmitter:Na+ symporter
MGGMQVFGSYLKKERTIVKDVIPIALADMTVSFLCLLMVFPAAKAFNIDAASGPGLLFVVMPNILNAMPGTAFWAVLLYLCFFFVAITTLFGIFEGIAAMIMDKFGCTRKKSTIINFFALMVLTLPAALSQSGGILSHIRMLDGITFAGLFPFLVSDNILLIGAIMYIIFCSHKTGWGWDEFIKEVNTGKGWKLPVNWRFYYAYIMPGFAIFVWVFGIFWRFIRPLIM